MSTEITIERESPLVTREITPLQLIQDALHKNVAPEVLKELVALQQSMVRFNWEAEERQSRIDFDAALASMQSKIGRIAPNKHNPGVRGNVWYLTYAKLDQIVRPLYTEAGFSICFGEEDCPTPGKIRVVAHVSRGGITRKFIKDVTPPLLGPKGEPVMTATHGDTSANSYARRYLIYDIFNVAVGIDASDNDGNGNDAAVEAMDADTFKNLAEIMEMAADRDDLREAYHKAMAACGVSVADLERSDWMQKAKYKKEGMAFVELKNKLLNAFGRSK